jgi:membrane protein DedA with SNARE-associated domain
MSPQEVAHLIIEYRYWILVPLAIVEGPIVAFITGTLASLHYFNLYGLMVFFFVRDMVMDAAWYYAGYFGWKTAFARRMLAKLGIQDSHIQEVHDLWEKYPARTMFIGKLSYGIAATFVAVAGVVKMSLTKFFSYGALVTFVEYGSLLLLGYFFGNAFGGSFAGIVDNIQYAIAGALGILSTFYILRWWIKKKFSEKETGNA